MTTSQRFGGNWTEQKLAMLEKYLNAYVTVMKKQSFFTKMYIDAFAGTGYREETGSSVFDDGGLFGDAPSSDDDDAKGYLDGSARIALKVEPGFDEYHFIERSPEKCGELEKLKLQFPGKAPAIHCHNAEANAYIQDICRQGRKFWSTHRAVLFLDPFGMNVDWITLEAVAATSSIDVWILFPLSMGVSRLLENKGNISEPRAQRLTKMLGTEEWRTAFYEKKAKTTLFGEGVDTIKKADYGLIGDFFIKRLQTIFPNVSESPLYLYNSKRNPLFMLCFAAGNAGVGGVIAKRIASTITKE